MRPGMWNHSPARAWPGRFCPRRRWPRWRFRGWPAGARSWSPSGGGRGRQLRARVLCCRTQEQMTWVPLMYTQTGIQTRNFSLPRALIDDVLRGTRDSGSIFLPTESPDDRGPTTAQRMAVYAEDSKELALTAARSALAESGEAPDRITHLVTVSCTGFVAPGIDLVLIRGLGLPATVQRTNVGFMGCHG